jgi:hypothetical protein
MSKLGLDNGLSLYMSPTPILLFFTPNFFFSNFFSSVLIFMIPYSSTNPIFFTKLHFNFFGVFGSMSKLGLDNGLSLYMSPIPPLLFSHQKIIIIIIFSSFSIFMIPYSSTNPTFFIKLHFNFF